MNSFEFTLILAEPEQSEDDAEALYAQFDDGLIVTTGGTSRVEFEREAEDLRAAIVSAIQDVERAGFRVARVESEVSDVIAGINAELVSSGR